MVQLIFNFSLNDYEKNDPNSKNEMIGAFLVLFVLITLK